MPRAGALCYCERGTYTLFIDQWRGEDILYLCAVKLGRELRWNNAVVAV